MLRFFDFVNCFAAWLNNLAPGLWYSPACRQAGVAHGPAQTPGYAGLRFVNKNLMIFMQIGNHRCRGIAFCLRIKDSHKMGTFAHAPHINLWTNGLIVKWYNGAFALRRREFDSPWVHKFMFMCGVAKTRVPCLPAGRDSA